MANEHFVRRSRTNRAQTTWFNKSKKPEMLLNMAFDMIATVRTTIHGQRLTPSPWSTSPTGVTLDRSCYNLQTSIPSGALKNQRLNSWRICAWHIKMHELIKAEPCVAARFESIAMALVSGQHFYTHIEMLLELLFGTMLCNGSRNRNTLNSWWHCNLAS